MPIPGIVTAGASLLGGLMPSGKQKGVGGLVDAVTGLFGGGDDDRMPKPRRGFGGRLRRLEEQLGIRARPRKFGGAGGPASRMVTAGEALRSGMFTQEEVRQMVMSGALAPHTMSSVPTPPPLASIGPPPSLPGTPVTGIADPSPTIGPPGGSALGSPVASAVARGAVGIAGMLARRFQRGRGSWPKVGRGPFNPGGEMIGVAGDDVPAPFGYPAGTNIEDLAEQTIAPDYWVRRLSGGVAVPASRIRKGHQVPLVDAQGDIEGHVVAHIDIPKNSLIVYPHQEAGAGDALLLMGSSSLVSRGTVWVRDFEGPDFHGLGHVITKRPKRRGGIHVSAKQLRTTKQTLSKLKKLEKTAQRSLPRKTVYRRK